MSLPWLLHLDPLSWGHPLLARASAVHKDPTNLFPEANTLGTALMDKVDPASPTSVCLDKDDGEKYLLYVTTRMMKALHMIAQAVELETRGVVHIEGTDLSAEERKQDLRDNLRRPIYVGFGQRSTHVFSADKNIQCQLKSDMARETFPRK